MTTLDEGPTDQGSEHASESKSGNIAELLPKPQSAPALLTEEQAELQRLLRLMMAGHKPV